MVKRRSIQEFDSPVEMPQVKETDSILTRPLDTIPLRVYLTIAGPKWDQMAGFGSYAFRNNLDNLTRDQWQFEYQKFMNKPV
jgi:hypothetical protein